MASRREGGYLSQPLMHFFGLNPLTRVSQEDLNTQECFWREVMSFDRDVDILWGVDLVGDLPSVKSRFDDLAELIEDRTNNPTGNIEG